MHEEIANRRKDLLDKLSYRLANGYDAIVVEDLNLQAISQCLKLGKSTHDNGFGMFCRMLRYKLEDRGKIFLAVDKHYPSSKLCSVCGYKNDGLTLNIREWTCPDCGTHLDRESLPRFIGHENAAINILKGRGASQCRNRRKTGGFPLSPAACC